MEYREENQMHELMNSEEYSQVSWNIFLLNTLLESVLFLVCNVTSEEHIVIQTPIQLVISSTNCSPRVLDELSLGHLVLDVGRRQVH